MPVLMMVNEPGDDKELCVARLDNWTTDKGPAAFGVPSELIGSV